MTNKNTAKYYDAVFCPCCKKQMLVASGTHTCPECLSDLDYIDENSIAITIEESEILYGDLLLKESY